MDGALQCCGQEESIEPALNCMKSLREWGDYFQLPAIIFILSLGQPSLQFVLDQGSGHRRNLGSLGSFLPINKCQ